MTTTPDTKTAEQIVAEALNEVWNFRTFRDAEEAAKVSTDALRAAGLLVSGVPSEVQIERADIVLYERGWSGTRTWDRDATEAGKLGYRNRASAVLTAAGVTPPAPLDRERLADVLNGILVDAVVFVEWAEGAKYNRLVDELATAALAVSPAPARDEWEAVSTAEQFDALPGGSIIMTASGGLLHKQRAEYWTKADDTSEQWTHQGVAECMSQPCRVIWKGEGNV